MRLDASLVELGYATDWTPASRKWFILHISTFIKWAEYQGVIEIEDIAAPLVRRYIEYRRITPKNWQVAEFIDPLWAYLGNQRPTEEGAWLHAPH